MRADIKQRWIDALNSGRYKKGKRRLCCINKTNDNAKYCCLGVLCELAVQDGVIPEPDRRRGECVAFDTVIDVLPESVSRWAGLYYSGGGNPFNPHIPDDNWLTLAEHNDGSWGRSKPKSFKQIAKLIEKYF